MEEITEEAVREATIQTLENDEALAAELRSGSLRPKQLRVQLAQVFGLESESDLKAHKETIIDVMMSFRDKIGEEQKTSGDVDSESDNESESQDDHSDDGLFEGLPAAYTNRFLDVVWVRQKGFKHWPSLIYDPRWVAGPTNKQAMKVLGKKHIVMFYSMNQNERYGFADDSDIVEWEEGFRRKLDKNAASFKSKKYVSAFPKAIEEASSDFAKEKSERGEQQHLSSQIKKKKRKKPAVSASPKPTVSAPPKPAVSAPPSKSRLKKPATSSATKKPAKKPATAAKDDDGDNDDDDEDEPEEREEDEEPAEEEEEEDAQQEDEDEDEEDAPDEEEDEEKPKKQKQRRARTKKKSEEKMEKKERKKREPKQKTEAAPPKKARKLSSASKKEEAKAKIAAAAAEEERHRRVLAAKQSNEPVWKALAAPPPDEAVPKGEPPPSLAVGADELSGAIKGESVVDATRAKAAIAKLRPHTEAIVGDINRLRTLADLLKVCTKASDASLAAASKAFRNALKKLHHQTMATPAATAKPEAPNGTQESKPAAASQRPKETSTPAVKRKHEDAPSRSTSPPPQRARTEPKTTDVPAKLDASAKAAEPRKPSPSRTAEPRKPPLDPRKLPSIPKRTPPSMPKKRTASSDPLADAFAR
ncbi:hypothetical protein CTAYLR_002747 [Chrysophaeum taylorii]|uniref:PWWP domain-containing protein n=1 Tax=Chrysophaeum taylorii TaxID=2483200 RepID=A0AAD7UC53_9STRA|nr:hypothetical protein CTAYLR_002747 [Chrysophaeum taylorii]